MHIRTGMRSSWLGIAAALLWSLMLLPVGCGGGSAVSTTGSGVVGGGGDAGGGGNGGGGGGPVDRFAAFRVRVDWGARTRVVGLSSALSARFTLPGAAQGGGDIVWVENRPEAQPGQSISQTYLSPVKAKVGSHVLTVDFFADSNASGDKVGFAQASASVLEDESLTVTISTYTGIQTVAVIPGQSVEVGETEDLAFEARDKNGNTVAVSHESAFFSIASGTANLEVVDNGAAVRGKRPIEAFVRVRVDNATSAPERIAVTSKTELAVSPVSATIGSEHPLELVATIINAPETDVTFRIVGGAGTQNGSLTNVTQSTARFLAPKVVGDEVREVDIEVVSNYDSTKRAIIPVTINAPATVTITPSPVTLSYEESVSLTAVVNNLSSLIPAGDSRRGVSWKVLADGSGQAVGKITRDGVYTAPKREGTFTVEAVSNYDATKVKTVAITVESAVAVTITPNPVQDLEWEQSVNLSATVVRTNNPQVNWSVVSPNGFSSALVATGATSARFTAPKVNGTYVVRATSAYDTRRSFSVSIKVETNVEVKVDPTPVRISVQGRKSFTSTVTGLPAGKTNSVTWSLTGPGGEPNTGNRYGTIDSATGAYIAPATVARDGAGKLELPLRVVATSVYDPAAKGSAVVTVVGGSIDGEVK